MGPECNNRLNKTTFKIREYVKNMKARLQQILDEFGSIDDYREYIQALRDEIDEKEADAAKLADINRR